MYAKKRLLFLLKIYKIKTRINEFLPPLAQPAFATVAIKATSESDQDNDAKNRQHNNPNIAWYCKISRHT